MDITGQIADLATPGANAAGLVVESVTVTAAGKRSRVLITVDLPPSDTGSAPLDAVADASRAISAALDEANIPSTPYVLEVSTPGTDRPLTELHHFMRARTRLVNLTLSDGSVVSGRLSDATDATVTLATDGGPVTIPMAGISRGRIDVELTRLGSEAKEG